MQNAYASYGTHCHSILERWAKGELMSFELADAYTAEYNEAVKEYFPPFPRGLAGKYYEEGLQYFSTFDGFGDCEIRSVEDKFELNIRGNRFVGIADLVLVFDEHAEILDYKTDRSRDAQYYIDEYAAQLRLYRRAFAQRLAVPVTKLTIYSFAIEDEIDVPLA